MSYEILLSSKFVKLKVFHITEAANLVYIQDKREPFLLQIAETIPQTSLNSDEFLTIPH